MSDATTNLVLPYILAAQAQKHVTHNEALRILDGLVQLSVLDRDLTAPPGSPADGDRYIVATGATGDWAGWDLNVALWTDGAWLRLPPRPGWRAWVEDEGLLLVYDGAGMWLCTRRLQAGSFAWPRQDTGSLQLTREQFDWLVAGLPWQRLGSAQPQSITVV